MLSATGRRLSADILDKANGYCKPLDAVKILMYILRRRWLGLVQKVAAETEFNVMHLKAVTKIPVQN